MKVNRATNYPNGIPTENHLRNLISDFVVMDARMVFDEDFGFNCLNFVTFAYEHPDEPIEPLISHLRKNGISILAYEETESDYYFDSTYSKWIDICFFAFSTEN